MAIAVELQVLRRRGARVRHVGPDAEAAAAMGTDFMATAPVRRGARGRAPPGPRAGRGLRERTAFERAYGAR